MNPTADYRLIEMTKKAFLVESQAGCFSSHLTGIPRFPHPTALKLLASPLKLLATALKLLATTLKLLATALKLLATTLKLLATTL